MRSVWSPSYNNRIKSWITLIIFQFIISKTDPVALEDHFIGLMVNKKYKLLFIDSFSPDHRYRLIVYGDVILKDAPFE